jgi:hypothetical protein
LDRIALRMDLFIPGRSRFVRGRCGELVGRGPNQDTQLSVA